jgi:hypothetical protein
MTELHDPAPGAQDAHGARKKAQEDGPVGWTIETHPGPEEPPRSDGRSSPKLDGFSQEDPDGSPSEEPSDRAQGSQKVGGSIL